MTMTINKKLIIVAWVIYLASVLFSGFYFKALTPTYIPLYKQYLSIALSSLIFPICAILALCTGLFAIINILFWISELNSDLMIKGIKTFLQFFPLTISIALIFAYSIIGNINNQNQWNDILALSSITYLYIMIPLQLILCVCTINDAKKDILKEI